MQKKKFTIDAKGVARFSIVTSKRILPGNKMKYFPILSANENPNDKAEHILLVSLACNSQYRRKQRFCEAKLTEEHKHRDVNFHCGQNGAFYTPPFFPFSYFNDVFLQVQANGLMNSHRRSLTFPARQSQSYPKSNSCHVFRRSAFRKKKTSRITSPRQVDFKSNLLSEHESVAVLTGKVV